MSRLPTLTPPNLKPELTTESMLFATPAEQNHAAATIDEGVNTTGFFRHLHTPRVLFGQDFTLRQAGLFR